jgi:hypothetical protein
MTVDIVFPVIHGQFGEDGGIQELLESAGLPFIGTSAAAARHAFDKVTFSFFMLQACHIVCDLLFGAKGRITSCILNPKPYHVAHIVGILLSVSCFACTV